MTVTISGGGTSLRMFLTQEDESSNEAGLVSTSILASDTDDVFLLPITASEQQSPSGRVVGTRVANAGGFSNNPRRALAEWCSRFESFIDGNQSGVTISSSERGRSIAGRIREANWEFSDQSSLEVEYSLEFLRGRGFDVSLGAIDGGSSPEGVNPRTTATLAGQPLGEIQTNRVTREQNILDINLPQVDFSDAGGPDLGMDDNLLIALGGPMRRINLQGTVTTSHTNLNSFEQGIRSRLGDMMNTVTYQESFPGRTMNVAVEEFSATRPAGRPHELDYRISLIEGMQIGDVLEDFDYDFSDALPDSG